MGKNNKKQHASYHPQHFKKGAGIVLGKSAAQQPSKLDLGAQKRVKTVAEDGAKAVKKAQVEVNVIDQHLVDPQVALTKLSPQQMIFDFNSKMDFTPDNDSVKIARKLWAYFMNPVPLPMFKETSAKVKCLHIARGVQEKELQETAVEEEKSDEDSYGSEDEEEEREGENRFSYDQAEPMDNLIDSGMVKDYLSGKIGVASADSGDAQPIEYGKHLDICRYLNGKLYSMNQSGKYEKDYALDMLDNQGCWVRLNRAHEWSVSLAKALCLTEELFHQDYSA